MKEKRISKYQKKSKKKLIIIVISSLIILSLVTLFFMPPKFELKKGDLTLEYGTKYKEPGYKVTKLGKDYTKKVKVVGKVNGNKVGKYKITYQIKINFLTYKTQRTVNITDSKKPEITLNGDKNTYVCPNKEYKEEGYNAIDDYDKDITDKVKITKKKNKIIYEVKDSSGNTSKAVRKLIYEDKTAPVITLKGNKNMTVYIGNKYSEPGYTAVDNCDENLTDKVKVDGTVNANKVGTYTVTYKVSDEAGNKSEIIRKINVVNKQEGSIIYLTFDDGPNSGTTDKILDILKEEGVKATFFVTGKGPDNLIKRQYDEGHTVALHTFSHNYQTVYSSVNNYYDDLYKIQNRVKNITGYTAKIIRFPGGSSNTISSKYSKGIMSKLTDDVLTKGFRYYDWNLSSGDAGEVSTASGVYNNVVNNLKQGRSNIILMHDIKSYTKDALRDIIKYGKNNGYTFAKITENTPMIVHSVNN